MDPDFANLHALLKRRLDVIGDHAWRNRDPAGHLDGLREVSEAIATEHSRLRGKVPSRLNHFLIQASYAKALEFLEANGES